MNRDCGIRVRPSRFPSGQNPSKMTIENPNFAEVLRLGRAAAINHSFWSTKITRADVLPPAAQAAANLTGEDYRSPWISSIRILRSSGTEDIVNVLGDNFLGRFRRVLNGRNCNTCPRALASPVPDQKRPRRPGHNEGKPTITCWCGQHRCDI
jgi:hypothetical protein